RAGPGARSSGGGRRRRVHRDTSESGPRIERRAEHGSAGGHAETARDSAEGPGRGPGRDKAWCGVSEITIHWRGGGVDFEGAEPMAAAGPGIFFLNGRAGFMNGRGVFPGSCTWTAKVLSADWRMNA